MRATLTITACALGIGLFADAAVPDEPPAKPKKVEPRGVYFFKNEKGVWFVTYSADGTGRSEAKLIVGGKVHDEKHQFTWTIKDDLIVRERVTDTPELRFVMHERYLPGDQIRPVKTVRDGKLVWEAPKDAPPMTFFGAEKD